MKSKYRFQIAIIVALVSYLMPLTTQARFTSVDPKAAKLPSISPYAYVSNNPLRKIDPDGMEEKEALKWMQTKLKGVKAGYWYAPDPNARNGKWRSFKQGEKPGALWCYQSTWNSYRNVQGDPYKSMPFSRSQGLDWFASNDASGPERMLQTDVSKGEAGDVLFMGAPTNMDGHAVLVQGVTQNKNGSISISTIGQFGGTDANGNPMIAERTFTATKNKDGKWIMNNGQEFKGYGQIKQEGE